MSCQSPPSMDLLQSQHWAYIAELPDDIGPARELLRTYSKIAPEDVDGHIMRTREDAWKMSRFPCVGRWRFLNLIDSRDPVYQQVLFRLTVTGSTDALLDLGCCFGQVIRQFRAATVRGSQLFGIDVESRFIELGYDLFQDRNHLGATFVVGDMKDPDDARLNQLNSKVTMIHAGSFFHLFNWTQQTYIGKRLVGFLKPATRNALIYGRHVGTSQAGPSTTGAKGAYIHDQSSFQRLWDEIGSLTGTKWQAQVEADGEATTLPGYGKEVFPVSFTVYQIS